MSYPRAIVRILRRKDRAYKAWRRYQTEANRQRYRELQSAAQRECRRFHRQKISRVADRMKEDPRAFWRLVKQLRWESGSVPTLVSDSRIFASPVEKADLLRSQFADEPASPGVSSSPGWNSSALFRPRVPMDRIIINDMGVLNLLMKVKVGKASGPDKIPSIFLREACFGLYKGLTNLFKLCISQRRIPNEWKKANVHPVFKKGDKSCAANYRPIALLSVISKLFEHIVVRYLAQHLDTNGLIDPRQHGFRRQRSCDTALISVFHTWAGVLDQTYSSVDAIFLDFKKAFDSVDHQLLLFKLRSFGISDEAFQLIANYLSDREHRVVVEGSFSKPFRVSRGVPQGSILGPLLFLVFINDLLSTVPRGSSVNAYADDTLLYRQIEQSSDALDLQADLNAVGTWAANWGLRFNVSKCVCMRISLRNAARRMYPPPQYVLNGSIISEVEHTRYLGVVVQNNFRFTRHIRELTNSCNKLIGLLKRNLYAANRSARRTAFIALVRSKLDFASVVYDPFETTHENLIEAVQNRGARFITRDYGRYSSVTDMKRELRFEPLSKRRREARHRIVRNFLADPSTIPGAKIVKKRNSFYFTPVVGLQILQNTTLYRTAFELFSALDDDGRQQRPP